MANPRFAYNNLIDASGVTFTPTSEATGLPVENLANALRTKVWRTGTSSADENVVIDLGSAQDVRCVILLDHDLTSGDSAIALEGNSSDSWGSPAFSQALTRVAGPIAAYFVTQSYRYWRLTFTKSSAGETRQIGRLYLGDYFDDSAKSDLDFDPEDLSKTSETIGGQSFSDVRAIRERINMEFDVLTREEIDKFQALAAAVGTYKPFFVSVDHDEEPVDWIYYVKLKAMMRRKTKSSLLFWQTSMSLEEQL